ncbi:hypothetical protein SCB49_11257 [unidentified eubacterium SCB49]|nr:hypothetical protein SCB49_11257 [unidentified eubacterium SCB49]
MKVTKIRENDFQFVPAGSKFKSVTESTTNPLYVFNNKSDKK